MRLRSKLLQSLYKRLTTGGSTEEQAVKSGVWVTGINIGDRVLQLIKVVILARILSPAAFGLLGIALLSVAVLKQFSAIGFEQALIQHEDEDIDDYLSTAWIVKISRGIIIATISLLIAPMISSFFNEPQAASLIQVLGFTPLILGVQNPAVVYFEKNLNFHKEFVYQVGARFVDLVVALIIALMYRSVWALVAGIIGMNLLKLILSYIIHDFRPSVGFNIDYFKEMFSFGKWMFISSILIFLYGQGDDAFVGWFFTATSLGLYQVSYRFSNAPATEVTHIISRVTFPAFSKVQNDVGRLRNGYFRSIQFSTIIAFPMAAGIAAVAPQFVPSVLGDQWGTMIPLMQVLALWGGLRAFGANGGSVFKAVGRPDIGVKIQALKVIIIAVLIYPAADLLGVVGVAWVIIGSTFITLPLHLYFVLTIIQGTATKLLNLTFYPLVGSGIMFAVVRIFDAYMLDDIGVIELGALIVIGMIIYLSIMIGFEKQTKYEFRSLVDVFRQSL